MLYDKFMTADQPTQLWNPAGYAQHAHFVSTLGQPVLDLLKLQPGERVLDLGCGDGVLSQKIAALGARVVGVDASPEMVGAAKRNGIDASVCDGAELTFNHEFNAVFSNAALHWMKRDPDAVIAGVYRALKPGGRFAGEMGGHGNVAAITVAAVAVLERRGIENPISLKPWFFPTVEDYRSRLERAGFAVEYIELIPRPTPLPTDMRGWLETFGMVFLKSLPEAGRAAAIEEIVAMLHPVLCDEQGKWTADYVRLRFAARKPE
jgi:trans-aconitate methyltransferase